MTFLVFNNKIGEPEEPSSVEHLWVILSPFTLVNKPYDTKISSI